MNKVKLFKYAHTRPFYHNTKMYVINSTLWLCDGLYCTLSLFPVQKTGGQRASQLRMPFRFKYCTIYIYYTYIIMDAGDAAEEDNNTNNNNRKPVQRWHVSRKFNVLTARHYILLRQWTTESVTSIAIRDTSRHVTNP